MTQINPLAGSIVQAPAAQRQQEAHKTTQIRSAHDRIKNSAASDEEEVEQSVASTDELQPIGDKQKGQQQRKGTYSRHPDPHPELDAEGEIIDLEA